MNGKGEDGLVLIKDVDIRLLGLDRGGGNNVRMGRVDQVCCCCKARS